MAEIHGHQKSRARELPPEPDPRLKCCLVETLQVNLPANWREAARSANEAHDERTCLVKSNHRAVQSRRCSASS
jgi:hypothetical protein